MAEWGGKPEWQWLEKPRPGASHGGRAWLSFVVIGFITALGILMLILT